MERWMNLDLEYTDNRSLKLDFVIVFRTIGVVLSGEGR
jgi:lipopolysaccharide/colanic/teichoic acid biosynthesis glycosyltransferase